MTFIISNYPLAANSDTLITTTVIMKAALQNMQSFLPDRVHQAMFIIDAPAPAS